MKKIFSFVLVACMAALAMTSCNDKNKPTDPTDPTKPDTKPVAAAIQFEATFDPITIEQCDISFDYYDENGNKKNEVVTTAEWKKTVQTPALPATLGFHMNLAVKPGLDETKYEYFVVDYHFTYFSVAINAKGAAVTDKEGASFGNRMEMAMSKREATATAVMNHNPINFLHKYDAEGKFTSEDWK
jgi:hypothetical protein